MRHQQFAISDVAISDVALTGVHCMKNKNVLECLHKIMNRPIVVLYMTSTLVGM